MPYNSLQCGMIKLGDIMQSVAKEVYKMAREKMAENTIKKPIEWKVWQERFKFLISTGGGLILIDVVLVVVITLVTFFSMSKAEREIYNPENIPIPDFIVYILFLGVFLIFVGAVLSGITKIGYYIQRRKENR